MALTASGVALLKLCVFDTTTANTVSIYIIKMCIFLLINATFFSFGYYLLV